MENRRIVTEYLERQGLSPVIDTDNEGDGLLLSVESNTFHLLGNPCDLIELADYLVSLALSGKDIGQHWHIDQTSIINENSAIPEIIACRNSRKI